METSDQYVHRAVKSDRPVAGASADLVRDRHMRVQIRVPST